MSSGSFTFCGIDVSSLGLEYAPDISETFVYRPAGTQSFINTYDSHNGGYYYGFNVEPKEFTLRCIFEEKNIDKGIMAKIYALFKVGKTGKLVFSRRPWCYYYATVTDPVQTEYTNYLNGIVTISLKAMYPFARSNITTVLRGDKNYEMLRANTAVFDKEDMELPIEYDLMEESHLLLANQGAERAALGFYLSGDVGEGIIIKNHTTQQECKMIKITNENTTDVNKEVFVDPINGKVLLIGDNTKEYAFKFHEYGFIELEPAYPAMRDIFINSVIGGTVSVANKIDQDITGRYIHINNEWHEILDQPDEHTLTVDSAVYLHKQTRTMAILMNEIEIRPITDMDVHIRFIYKPTYA